jgi:hypothetical protein
MRPSSSLKTPRGVPAALAATLTYLAVVVPAFVLLIRNNTVLGISLLAVGHAWAWGFGRWHHRKYFGHQAQP